jgi:uncharacterized membrane protein YciS (DUF1049 family)
MEVKMQAIGFAIGVVLGAAIVAMFYYEHCHQLKQTIESQENVIRELENRISRQRRSLSSYGVMLRKKIERMA